MWYLMSHSGVHATITGVLLAFAVPFGCGGEKSPSYILQHILHKPVAFIILPLFALANTSIVIEDCWYKCLGSDLSLGILFGLILGKPFGILLFSKIAIGLKLTSLPQEIKFKHLFGAGFLGGIGFTMSVFITLLAFENATFINTAKIAVLVASLAAGVIGFLMLKKSLKY